MASKLKTHKGQEKQKKETGKPVGLSAHERQWDPAVPSLTRWAPAGQLPSSWLHFLISEGTGQAHFMSFMELSQVGSSDASVWGSVRTQQRAGNTQTYVGTRQASGKVGTARTWTPQDLERMTRAGIQQSAEVADHTPRCPQAQEVMGRGDPSAQEPGSEPSLV